MVQLAYQSSGTGQAVIVLHGLFGAARNWLGIARQLSEHYQVITADLRNHGNSPHIAGMHYNQMAADVHELITGLNIESPVIIGHSMGGKVAMTLALTKPELMKGLIIVDIAPVNYDHDFSDLINAMRTLSLTDVSSRAEAQAILANQLASEKLVAFILQNLKRTGEGLSWRINLDEVAQNLPGIGQFPDELHGLANHNPALFIGGTESSYIKEHHHESIYRYFPAAEIKMLTGAGHWTHVDKPEEFLLLINNFIDAL